MMLFQKIRVFSKIRFSVLYPRLWHNLKLFLNFDFNIENLIFEILEFIFQYKILVCFDKVIVVCC